MHWLSQLIIHIWKITITMTVEKLKVFLTILLVNTMDMLLDYQDKRCTGKDKKTAMIYSNDKENQVSRVQTIVIFGW